MYHNNNDILIYENRVLYSIDSRVYKLHDNNMVYDDHINDCDTSMTSLYGMRLWVELVT